MKNLLQHATDARQSAAWGTYLLFHQWQTKKIGQTYLFSRQFPLFNRAFFKIQHPKGNIPFEEIEKLAKQDHALFTIIEPHIVGFDEALYRSYGYQNSKLRFAHSATILIDLQPALSMIFASFSENARRNIRKAEKQLVVKQMPITDASIELFYSLYKQVGTTRKFYVPSFQEAKAKVLAFKKTSALFFAYEKTSTKPLAVLLVGSVGETLIYFHPGNTQRGYELLANYLLVWEAIKYGKTHKLKVFDFETAYDERYPQENKKWQGYTAFKKKFGGEMIHYPPSQVKFYNPIAKWLYTFGTLFSQ